MRTVVDGQLWLSYSHAYLTSEGEEYPEPGTSCSGQVNGLCGAATPGSLLIVTGLHTGEVPITVEVHDEEPPVDPGWEEVVEVPFAPIEENLLLIGCLGGSEHRFVLDVEPYRVRYCATGMDAARAADTRSADDPELDRYLLQFWPAPPSPDRIVRQTSDIATYWHGVARDAPSPEALAEKRRAQDEEAAAERERQTARYRAWRDEQIWGGPRPEEPLASIPEGPEVARLDRPLAEALARATPERQRMVARWAARAAAREAGLDRIGWVAAALDALDAGSALAPPCDGPAQAVDRLFTDPAVRHTVVTHPDGSTTNLSQQAMAICAVVVAADPDPARAGFVAVQHAGLTYGRDRLDVLHRAVRDVVLDG